MAANATPEVCECRRYVSSERAAHTISTSVNRKSENGTVTGGLASSITVA